MTVESLKNWAEWTSNSISLKQLAEQLSNTVSVMQKKKFKGMTVHKFYSELNRSLFLSKLKQLPAAQATINKSSIQLKPEPVSNNVVSDASLDQ
jgi:hypothetical protein